jgi:hypothetical protein
MPTCWAESMGDCNGGISREHYVSKSLFKSSAVSVEGFPWCKGTARTVGIASLTGKILCQTHNNNLSPLDEEASALFDAIREWFARENIRKNTSPLARIARPPTLVKARLLERWFLKTLLNLSLCRDYFIGVNGVEKGVVPHDLVQVCFGNRPFDGAGGMYGAAQAGMTIASHDALNFAPLLREDRVLGGLFEFRGFRFVLSLLPDGLHTMPQMTGVDSGWQQARLLRPIELIQMQISALITVPVIRFQW